MRDLVSSAVSRDEIADYVLSVFDGVTPTKTWGETAFFFSSGLEMKRGIYVCTLKDKDGENDSGSCLDRPGVYRLNIGLPADVFVSHFGPKPARPPKGGVIAGPWDFTALNQLTPHPVYGWMGWVAVLCPSAETLEQCKPLLRLAYDKAVASFAKRSKL